MRGTTLTRTPGPGRDQSLPAGASLYRTSLKGTNQRSEDQSSTAESPPGPRAAEGMDQATYAATPDGGRTTRYRSPGGTRARHEDELVKGTRAHYLGWRGGN